MSVLLGMSHCRLSRIDRHLSRVGAEGITARMKEYRRKMEDFSELGHLHQDKDPIVAMNKPGRRHGDKGQDGEWRSAGPMHSLTVESRSTTSKFTALGREAKEHRHRGTESWGGARGLSRRQG